MTRRSSSDHPRELPAHLDRFIAYNLHRAHLSERITYTTLLLFQNLEALFPAAEDLSASKSNTSVRPLWARTVSHTHVVSAEVDTGHCRRIISLHSAAVLPTRRLL